MSSLTGSSKNLAIKEDLPDYFSPTNTTVLSVEMTRQWILEFKYIPALSLFLAEAMDHKSPVGCWLVVGY